MFPRRLSDWLTRGCEGVLFWVNPVGRALVGTFRKPHNGRFGVFCNRGRNNIPLTQEARDYVGLVSSVYDPGLVFNGVEDLVDRKLQRSEALLTCNLGEYLEGGLEMLALVRRLSLVSILRVVGSFMQRLRLSSTIAWFHGVVRWRLHHLFKLDVKPSSGMTSLILVHYASGGFCTEDE